MRRYTAPRDDRPHLHIVARSDDVPPKDLTDALELYAEELPQHHDLSAFALGSWGTMTSISTTSTAIGLPPIPLP